MIAGYVGGSPSWTRRWSGSPARYADQTEADHAALVKAVDRGLLPVERGV